MDLSRRIWHIGTFMVLFILVISGRLIYWQVVRADELQPVVLNPLRGGRAAEERLLKELDPEVLARGEELPLPVVQRLAELLENVERGTIYDRNGQVLAETVTDESGATVRVYPHPATAQAVGYVSPLGIGVAGAERAFNETLLGLDRLGGRLNQLVHRPITGNDIYLTIDSVVQEAAVEALAGRPGAVVVLDAPSGEVLALASTPLYDPNQISEVGYLSGLASCTDPSCEGALLNRATQGLYPPGSTWKTVTLIAALDSGQVTPDTVFDFGQPRQGPNGIYYVYQVDGAEIIDPNHPEPRLNLVRSYAVSANAAFARLGDEMPPAVFRDYAARMGFSRENGAPPLEIGAVPAQLAYEPQDIFENNVLRAATAFGQGELLTSPLTMALVVAGVTNAGMIPTPHVLARVTSPDGNVLRTAPAEPWIAGVMRPETAQQVAEIMATAVASGSGVNAALPGATVGGKTGTAEVGEGRAPHAWFIGFAHENDRTVVIAVVVENAGEGADVAAPIFRRVAETALRSPGAPDNEQP